MKKINFLVLILFGIYLYFTISSLINIDWLADEVYHIRFINEWFLTHFKDYFFQLEHNIYPPKSPEFGNPPLAMFLMTFGMFIGNFFNISYLYSARLINLVAGSFSFFLIYLICKEAYKGSTKYFSLILYITFPALIVINSTAYLDAILITLSLLYYYTFILFLKTESKKYFILTSIIAGLAFITKYQFIMMFLPSFIIFYPRVKKIIRNKQTFLFYFIYIYLTAAVIWAGIRDLNHMLRVFASLSGFAIGNVTEVGGMFSDYTPLTGGVLNNYAYYFIILIGKSPISVLMGFILLIIGLLFFGKKYFNKDEIYFSFVFFVILIFPLLIFGVIGGVPNSIHRISMVLPFFVILSGFGYELVTIWINGLFNIKITIFLAALILILTLIPIIALSSNYYNSYSNNLDKMYNFDKHLYINGDGEGLSEAAQWIVNNNLSDKNIAIVRHRFLMLEYLPNGHFYDFPMTEGYNYIGERNIDYVVIHRAHTTGGLKPVFLQDKQHFEILYTIKTNLGEDLVYIYKVKSIG